MNLKNCCLFSFGPPTRELGNHHSRLINETSKLLPAQKNPKPTDAKQNKIIALCKTIYSYDSDDISKLKTDIRAVIEQLGDDNTRREWFKQDISRSQMYAWVSVYACMHLGSAPYDFSQLCGFISEKFGINLIPNSETAKTYFYQIQDKRDVDIRTLGSHGGQTYNLPEIRRHWQVSAFVVVTNNDQISKIVKRATGICNPKHISTFLNRAKN